MTSKIHPTACIDDDVLIGEGTTIWHFSHIMSGAIIGKSCNLGQNVVVSPGVKLGNGCKVQNNVSIYAGVICEDFVFLGPSMVFTNVMNPRAAVVRKNEYRQTIVHVGASIGANATIVCGVRIGKYAFVGAGAVVIRDVPDHAMVVGNPSRQIGWVSEYGNKLNFDSSGIAICPETQQKYQLKNDEVVELV